MTAFEEYTDQYGCHFSRKLYEWAVSMMRDRNGNSTKPVEKEQVKEFLEAHGLTVKNDKGYDAAYVYHMAKADYFGMIRTEARPRPSTTSSLTAVQRESLSSGMRCYDKGSASYRKMGGGVHLCR